jgi:hypothetical protein
LTALLTNAEVRELLDGFEHTAWRLEARDRYNEPGEEEALRRFRSGQAPDEAWFSDWSEAVQRWTASGKRIERVRIVSQPHSEYVRWLLQLARLNIEAGEDIRYLPRPRADELGLPYEDFWLFDSQRFVLMRFDSDDVRVANELIYDPVEVVRRCQWRDVAWHYAIPYQTYLEEYGQD